MSARPGQFAAHALDDIDGFRHVAFLDDQGRCQTQHIVASGGGQEAFGADRIQHLGIGHPAAQTEQQPGATHLRQDFPVARHQSLQARAQETGNLLDPRQEAVGQHHVEHGVADRHGQRIAAEGAAVAAAGHAIADRRGGQAGTHREAAAQALGHGQHIGCDSGGFVGEKTPGPADAALDLVENQQQSIFVANLAQGLQILGRGHADPALALDRLDQHGGGLGRDRGAQFVHVVEGDLIEAVHRGREARHMLRVGRRRQGGERPPVKRAGQGDDAVALGFAALVVVPAHRLEAAFQRLGARIAEEHPLGEAGRAEALGEALALGYAVEVGAVPQLLGLPG